MRRYILSITTVAISLFSISAFAENLVCTETGRNPQVQVTAESSDMSALQNLTFQFSKGVVTIMDYRAEGETLPKNPVSLKLPKSVKASISYRAEKNTWIEGGSMDCIYEFLIPNKRGKNFQGFLAAYCVSGDGGQWKVDEFLDCKFQ